MKFTCLSDTHGLHNQITKDLGSGDFLIHAGDVSNKGKTDEILEFLEWFAEQPFTHKVFIAGNHDFGLEKHGDMSQGVRDKGVVYLMDNMVELDGIKIYGSPWQPRFYDWAFNVDRGPKIAAKWKDIPEGLDLLITHGPPWGILDDTPDGMHVGCEDLLAKILEVKPKFHTFGHVHHGFGMRITDDITYINASVLNEQYRYRNKPIQFNL